MRTITPKKSEAEGFRAPMNGEVFQGRTSGDIYVVMKDREGRPVLIDLGTMQVATTQTITASYRKLESGSRIELEV